MEDQEYDFGDLDIQPKPVVDNHEERSVGYWTCPAVGKNNVSVVTTRGGFKACGHCLKYITKDGKKQPFSLLDLVNHNLATGSKKG